jgi:hypothetical protein
MRSTLLRASLVGLALLVLGPAAAPASADVVRLRTGENVKCRPLRERSDERLLVVEDLQRGTIRTLAWEALETADRDRIQEQWEWKGRAVSTAKGHRIVTRVGDDEQEMYGVIEREEGGIVYLRRNGEVLPVPAAQIVERSEENLDPREIWGPQQLMEQLAAELAQQDPPQTLDSTDGRTAWRVGEHAEWAGALPQALEAFRRAAADPEFLNRASAEQRATRVEALLKDQAALATVRDLKVKLSSNLYKAVRAGLDGFEAKHPGSSEAVLKALETFKSEFAKRRDKHFRQMARFEFARKVCRKLIDAKVREKDITLADARSWAKRDLPDAAFDALAERMGKVDTVTPEEVRAWWDTRWQGVMKSSWSRASYGAGTFIAYKPKMQAPKPRPGGAGGGGNRGGGNQGPAPQIEIPKPPTPDEWWAKATNDERSSWLMAHFAQSSQLFEVADDVELSPCRTCLGAGTITKMLQTGDTLVYLCPRCGGARNDVTVKFR